ncbi:MAG: cytochrome P450, partial [Proteobacteria bacterium]
MPHMPRLPTLDSTLSLIKDPYQYLHKKSQQLKSTIFETRILLQRTIVMTGKEAAAMFYNTDLFQRADAAPGLLKATLFGEGAVQTLDDLPHKHRKSMFREMMSEDRVKTLGLIFQSHFMAKLAKHRPFDKLVLYDELQKILYDAAWEWTGISHSEVDSKRHREEITALYDKAGRMGVHHLESRLARKTSERWVERMILDIRSGKLQVNSDLPAAKIANHRDLDGNLLDARTAAVELINVIRPITAVSVYIVFVALALHDYPLAPNYLREEDRLESFVQEVRRYYPFFPAAIARVRKDFRSEGIDFDKGTRAMLDLYGTNHNESTWKDGDRFIADRFLTQKISPYNFVPQG